MEPDTLLAAPYKRPIVIVNGKVYHYHRAEIAQPDREEEEREPLIDRLDQRRPVFRPSFPFHLTLSTYLAPGVRDTSIWLVRRWRAESYIQESRSGANLKPSRKRGRVIFENAVPVWPAIEHEIRRRTPKDLRPPWMRDKPHACQYMEQQETGDGQTTHHPGLCHRAAVYVVMWKPIGRPVVDHFGYICDYHKADFEAFIKATQPNPSDYKLWRLH